MLGVLLSQLEKQETVFFASTIYTGQGAKNRAAITFDLEDATTIKAIKDRGHVVFEILEDMLSLAHWIPGIEETLHNLGNGWEYAKRGGQEHFKNYQASLKEILDNPFVSQSFKAHARTELKNIKIDQENDAATKKRRAAKKQLMKRRRNEFDKKRPALEQALIERDDYECAICHAIDNLTIDHIIPVSKNGTDELNNLRWLCRSCNSRKGNR